MSNGGGRPATIWREYNRRRKLDSCTLRRKFLLDCLEEQVLPRAAPKQLQSDASPFSNSARIYLEEQCKDLQNNVDELNSEVNNIILPRILLERLIIEKLEQSRSLKCELSYRCEKSQWNSVGRAELIRNISNRVLTATEKQALSLGLKFDTGISTRNYIESLNYNYKWNESDVNKGFVQGVITCYHALANSEKCAIPRRYKLALQKLGKDDSIVINRADKGGGVVIMNRDDYINKMLDLLNDSSTYAKKNDTYAKSESEKFNKEVRKILRKSEKGKKLINTLEEAPRTPTMYGLPKIHKPNIPMRPITSGIGSAPHRLAKCLAKPLSNTLGTISQAHLKNSSDLIERIKGVNFSGKKMASFDVKSLFTNVPVDGAMEAVKRAINKINVNDLPVGKNDYIKLVSLCVRFGVFTFNNITYQQHHGLAMGSPLSAVMACLYMEMLEKEEYLRIIGRGSHWYRYVDDIIVIMPETTNVDNKLRMLNKVNVNIQFTIELEKDNKLPFLDTIIIRQNNEVKFTVYRKPTNKDDFIHFYSAHNDRTKSGVVIGFFLRALRICSVDYLEEECTYIREAFKKLKYPSGMICKLRGKAVEIHNRPRNPEESRKNIIYLAVPNSRGTDHIDRYLKAGINIARVSGKKIGNFVKPKIDIKHSNDLSVVYRIPCNGCTSTYYGESGRGAEKRLAEHKNDLRAHRTSNALVNHVDEHGHLPNWQEAEILHSGWSKGLRKTIEAAYITVNQATNCRDGFVNLSNVAGELVVKTARKAGLPPTNNQSGTRRPPRRPAR